MEFTLPYSNGKELGIRKHVVKYSQDGFTFRFYATCVSPEESCLPVNSLTLMICHGLGLRKFSSVLFSQVCVI